METTSQAVTPSSAGTGGRQERRVGDGTLEALPMHLVDLGKARPKAIKQLKKGGGKLHQAVVDSLSEIEFNLGKEATSKTILPVVVVVEKKRKRRAGFPLSIF